MAAKDLWRQVSSDDQLSAGIRSRHHRGRAEGDRETHRHSKDKREAQGLRMSQELCWIFGFNIIVNSLLSFFTAFFLLELFLFIFRVRHPRLRAVCSLLPFVKICLDVFSYHFSHWALLQG